MNRPPAAPTEYAESAGDSPGAPARPGAADSAGAGRSPKVRTLFLALVLAVSSGGLLARVGEGAGATALPWWSLAIMFGVTELAVFHIEVRREAHTFTLSEIPLVLGLLFASPLSLVVGRLVGAGLLLAIHERQPLRKLALNLSAFAAECTVGAAALMLLPGPVDLASPMTWLAVAVAVALADATTIAAVMVAMRWHGASSNPTHVLVTNAVTAITNTALALVAALLLRMAPLAMLLIAVIAGVFLLAYQGYTGLHQRYASLQLLYDFTRLMSGSKRPDAVLEAILGKARELLRSERAGIILFAPSVPANPRDEDDDAPVEPETGVMETLWVGDPTLSGQLEAGAIRQAGPTTIDVAFLERVVRRGTSVVVAASASDEESRQLLDLLECRDCILAPVSDSSGVIGVLIVANRMSEVSTFDPADGRLFESLANHASVALENGRLIDRLHAEATRRGVRGAPRRPDRAAEPGDVRRRAGRGAGSGGATAAGQDRRDGGCGDGPGPLQGDQRHARPPLRGPAAADRRPAAAQRRGPRHLRGPPRWRRVRLSRPLCDEPGEAAGAWPDDP